MSDLHTRLQSFLAESSTRKLARLAPATLLASSAGLSLAALIGSQAFSSSAAASSWVVSQLTLPRHSWKSS